MSDIVRSDPAHAQHAEWSPPRNRTDPVSLLEAQNERRDLDLVPIRHGRMMVSLFTFYRGTATVMAADLATMPTAGLWVQLCGDAHLSNSGLVGGAEQGRHYYWRQLRDMKGSAVVEAMVPAGMTFYAKICGWTLARAHARSGDPVAISGYLGSTGQFDQAVVEFAARYADQNDRDYEAFRDAISSGRIEARSGI